MPTKEKNPANLLDMIALISSRRLQEEIFTINAPGMTIQWDALPKDRVSRAQLLYKKVEDFAQKKDKPSKEQHEALFRTLNTIAMINADTGGGDDIREKINYKIALRQYRDDSFDRYDLPEGRSDTANLAAFVNVTRRFDTQAGKEAREIWDDLVASATAAYDNIKHDTYSLLPARKGHNQTKGLADFEDAIKLAVESASKQQDYLVIAVPNHMDDRVRYLVKTSPLDHEVPKVLKDKDGNRKMGLGPADTTVGFEIIYFPQHNYIKVSRFSTLRTSDVATFFAKCVLGSDLDTAPRRYFNEPLQSLRTPQCLEKIKLPDDMTKNGDSIFISKLRVCPVKKIQASNGEPEKTIVCNATTFTGTPVRTVFQDMDDQNNPLEFPRNLRKVMAAEITLDLHKSKPINGKLVALGNPKKYYINISERHFTIKDKRKVKDQYFLDIFSKLQDAWGFQGLTPEEHLHNNPDEIVAEEDSDDLFG